EDLFRRHTSGIPDDPRLDSRRGALNVTRRDREVAILLRDHLERYVESVLLEDTGFLGERQRRESGPAGHADRNLGVLRKSMDGNEYEGGAKSGRDGGVLEHGVFSRNKRKGNLWQRRRAAPRCQCSGGVAVRVRARIAPSVTTPIASPCRPLTTS